MSERTDMQVPKPRPIPTPVSEPFWAALAEDRLVIPRCESCGHWFFYPRERCPQCLSDAISWHEVSGAGTVFTYSIATQPTAPMFADEVPQIIAIVELDEGVRMTSTITDTPIEALHVGARVEPVFDHGDDGRTLLRHRIVD